MPTDPTITSLTASDPAAPRGVVGRAWGRLRAGWRVAAMTTCAAAAGAVAASSRDPLVLGMALLGVVASVLAGLAFAPQPPSSAAVQVTDDPLGAQLPKDDTRTSGLSAQVVPVWQRNLESAREHSSRSAEGLLESFARISAHMDQALSGQGVDLELGAVEAVLVQHQPQLDALMATTRKSVALKDRMLAEVVAMSDALGEMVVATKEVQAIARATHLLSMNASIEATRAGAGQAGGVGVVAEEVRRLASQSREAGNCIARHVTAMQGRMQALRLSVMSYDTEEDELLRSAEEAARKVIASLLDSLSHVNRSSRVLRNAGRQLQRDIEIILVEMQAQDRLSQMLCAVADDMKRFVHWSGGGVDEAAASPAQWLKRLESTYTMEEQRSTHHGGVAVQHEATVEFF
jgi:methyl-accepting chemotaxis protein